jgi:hypothetical protein
VPSVLSSSILAAVLAAGASAHSMAQSAQPATQPAATPADLRAAPTAAPGQRVDQTRGDVGPISSSLSRTDMGAELRTPTGFESVYRLPGLGPDGRPQFARSSGAITAVFSRSAYASAGGATFAEVPAGTTYFIGRLPDRPLAPGLDRPGQASTFVSTLAPGAISTSTRDSAGLSTGPSTGFPAGSRDRSLPAPSPQPLPAERTTRPASVMLDEWYRVKRVNELLREAARSAVEAERRPPSTPDAAPSAAPAR